VCLEAVFKRGEVLAPVLSAKRKRLRDEAFGRFWLEFSGEFCFCLFVFIYPIF